MVKQKGLLTKISLVLFIAALVLGACSGAAAPTSVADMAREAESPQTVSYDSANSAAGSGSAQAVERIVIKNASISISVADPSKSMTTISKMAEDMGGFVVSANVYKEQLGGGVEVPRASITVRVPAEKLNAALDIIRGESKVTPISESLNSQDVTNEYIDLQSRQKNLEAAEADLVKIMDEAYKTEDVLTVYNQLVSIREQIEVIKGQIKYYSESAHFSAISIELIADAAVQPLEIAGWQPKGVAKEAINALIKTMQGLGTVLIWLVLDIIPVLLVVFIIFFLPFILLIRAWLRRRARRKAAKAAAGVELAQQTPPDPRA